jgi:hypothetical protein
MYEITENKTINVLKNQSKEPKFTQKPIFALIWAAIKGAESKYMLSLPVE